MFVQNLLFLLRYGSTHCLRRSKLQSLVSIQWLGTLLASPGIGSLDCLLYLIKQDIVSASLLLVQLLVIPICVNKSLKFVIIRLLNSSHCIFYGKGVTIDIAAIVLVNFLWIIVLHDNEYVQLAHLGHFYCLPEQRPLPLTLQVNPFGLILDKVFTSHFLFSLHFNRLSAFDIL